MEVARVARQRFLDDVANSVGETFMAHSLQCARCHDHKFDPVPTRDYYSLQAVFATAQLSERPAPFLPEENTAGFGEKKFLEARRGQYLAVLKQLDEKLVRNAAVWFKEKGLDPTQWNAAIEQARGQAPVNRNGRRREFGGLFDGARAAMAKQGVPGINTRPSWSASRPRTTATNASRARVSNGSNGNSTATNPSRCRSTAAAPPT
jgi:hypothetical protein